MPDYWLISVSLYLDKSELLSGMELCQALYDTKSPIPVCQKHLILVCAAWGSIVNSRQLSAVTTNLLELLIESETALMAEPDSLNKFIVWLPNWFVSKCLLIECQSMVANVSNHNLCENLAADFSQTQLAHKLGLLHLQRLLAASVSIIHSLNLIHAEAAQQLISPGAGCASSVKHACWIVIYIDKVTALRRRSFSVRLPKKKSVHCKQCD